MLNGAVLGGLLKQSFLAHCSGEGLGSAIHEHSIANGIMICAAEQVQNGALLVEAGRRTDEACMAIGRGIVAYLGSDALWGAIGSVIVAHVRTATITSGSGAAVKGPATIS